MGFHSLFGLIEPPPLLHHAPPPHLTTPWQQPLPLHHGSNRCHQPTPPVTPLTPATTSTLSPTVAITTSSRCHPTKAAAATPHHLHPVNRADHTSISTSAAFINIITTTVAATKNHHHSTLVFSEFGWFCLLELILFSFHDMVSFCSFDSIIMHAA
nr:hypothetical protein [Tanacetum cinerariifolium]